MDISVLGTGYVGLVTGCCLAELGMNIVCADNNKDKINNLKSLIIPIYEPGLESILIRNKDRLQFTLNIKEAVEHGEIIFISVGTPSLQDGKTDLKYIFKIAKEIAGYINNYKLIIIKSTVPVGTCQKVKNIIKDILKKKKNNNDFDIVSNPEFLREGTAVDDFFSPDRIVIGTENKKAESLIKRIYDNQVFKNTPIVFTNLETSEMIKYASNAFLATKISFINEIANICELCGADISVVARAMGLDKRIGEKFLNPGPGFGGSCFPKDINSLIKTGEDLGYKPQIIDRVMKSNIEQKKRSIKTITKIVGEIENKTFTVLGLAFKAGTDDIRESPAIYIVNALLEKNAKIKVYDPKAMKNIMEQYPDSAVQFCEDEYSACTGSDCIIIATEWEQFKSLDFSRIKNTVNNPVLIDFKNLYEPNSIIQAGFLYKGIGR